MNEIDILVNTVIKHGKEIDSLKVTASTTEREIFQIRKRLSEDENIIGSIISDYKKLERKYEHLLESVDCLAKAVEILDEKVSSGNLATDNPLVKEQQEQFSIITAKIDSIARYICENTGLEK